MGWSFTTDVEQYAAEVLPLLCVAPDQHCAALGVITDVRARPVRDDPLDVFGWWTDSTGRVTGAVSICPPDPPLLEVVPEPAVGPLVEHLAATGQVLSGVTGPTDVAVSFAAQAAERLGLTVRLDHAMVQYRAHQLARPDRPPHGQARPAAARDVVLLQDWVRAVAEEAGASPSDAMDASTGLDLLDGSYQVWEDGEGQVVCMAGHAQPAWGAVRVGPVYTPPEVRGRGYASALTYAVTSTLMAQGLEPVLFTDLTSAAPNRLYRRLGYRRVSQWVALSLS